MQSYWWMQVSYRCNDCPCSFLDFSSTPLANFSLWASSFFAIAAIGHANDLRSQDSCVGCAGLADGYRGYGNSGGHLNCR